MQGMLRLKLPYARYAKIAVTTDVQGTLRFRLPCGDALRERLPYARYAEIEVTICKVL